METYLLDTNIASYIANEKHQDNLACVTRLRSATEKGKVLLPVISIAEIEFGLQKGGKPDSQDARRIRTFLATFEHLPFDDNSVEPYALIRSKILALHPQEKKKRCPEQWVDRVTGKELGIDERDLLIASIAVQYNCVLVTDDANEGMRRIREAAAFLPLKASLYGCAWRIGAKLLRRNSSIPFSRRPQESGPQ